MHTCILQVCLAHVWKGLSAGFPVAGYYGCGSHQYRRDIVINNHQHCVLSEYFCHFYLRISDSGECYASVVSHSHIVEYRL